MIYSTQAYGQSITFNKSFDFDMSAGVLTGVIATDSCYYATGIIGDIVPPYYTGNVFACFDLDGSLRFQKTLTSTERTYETWNQSFQETKDNNFVVAGYSFVQNNMYQTLIKFDSNGDTVFVKDFRGLDDNYEDYFVKSNDLVETLDGGYLLGGYEVTAPNNTDFVYIKTDSLGNKEWGSIIGTDDLAERVTCFFSPPNEESVIVGGLSQNWVLSNDENYEDFAYLAKMDYLGNIEWETNFESELDFGEEYEFMLGISSLVINDDGSIIGTSGLGYNVAPWAHAPVVAAHPIIFKMNNNQEVEWETPIIVDIENPTNDVFHSLIKLDDGTYLGVGEFIGEIELENGLTEKRTGAIVKVDDNGTILWKRFYNYSTNPNARHRLYDVKEATDGGFIMVGQFSDSELAPVTQRAWLVKTDEHGCLVPGCHLTDNVELPDNEIILRLYPNPTSDYLNIYCKQNSIPKNATFQVVDLQGQVLDTFEHHYSDVTHVLSVSHLANGLYVLQYKEDEVVRFSEQFVVTH